MTGWRTAAADLPIGEVLDPLEQTLAAGRRLVLQAPPGAGKTTIVPLVLAEAAWCRGTVVVLEPRRLAVRAAAQRMAALTGTRPGTFVGWRMRHDTRVQASTRVVVVTEGVFTRMLQSDPMLTGVDAVVFDEFHERSLDADLGLALALETLEVRDDLRVVVMSATLDADAVAEMLTAPVISSAGRSHAVEVEYLDTDRSSRPEQVVPAAVRRALATSPGDVLVFLPGAREIDRTVAALADLPPDVDVRPLHGSLPADAQDLAVAVAPLRRRKVVVSTSIAETSLTIEGVTAVVDAGWRRRPRWDARSGMSRLVTQPVSVAEADQRAGRAGRLRPGVAYRLWSRAEHATLRRQPEPEIVDADLAPLALDLASWGSSEAQLRWLTPPPAGHLAAARDLLELLGALEDGAITAHGRAMAEVPLHPRLAHLAIAGAALGAGTEARRLAAALGEDGLRQRDDIDLASRLRALDRPRPRQRAAAERARRDVRRLVERPEADDARAEDVEELSLGRLAGLAFPDRIARARPGRRGEFVLANGRGAFLDQADPLAAAAHLVATDLDGDPRRARIREAAPLEGAEVRALLGHRIEVVDEVRWDDRSDDVRARRVERAGALVLGDGPIDDPDPALVRAALCEGIVRHDLALLPWTDESRRLRDRLGFLHRLEPSRFPAVDDDSLRDELDERVGPHLHGMRRRADLRRLPMHEVLLHGLGWSERRAVDELAPERLRAPSGHSHRVDYESDPPVLAVKLQEMFGTVETPTVGGGRVPVVLHLLSPAGRPLQVTQDLASFWSGAYAQVRADMRGRYPKHPWPEDPTTAPPTARAKGRG